MIHIGPRAVLGILKRLDGLDFANGPHKILEIAIQRFGRFCKYIKLLEQSTVEI